MAHAWTHPQNPRRVGGTDALNSARPRATRGNCGRSADQARWLCRLFELAQSAASGRGAKPVISDAESGLTENARQDSCWRLPGGVKAKSDSAVAAAPHGDALYVGYTTHQPGAAHSDIVVTASHDQGRTWSQPIKATPDDAVTYFQPNLAVDEAGRVAISAFALQGGNVDEVLLVSTPGQLHFSAPLRVTTTAFDPRRGSIDSNEKEGAWWIGDYQGITTGAGAFHLVWNDARTGNLQLFAASVHP